MKVLGSEQYQENCSSYVGHKRASQNCAGCLVNPEIVKEKMDLGLRQVGEVFRRGRAWSEGICIYGFLPFLEHFQF